MRVLLVEDSQGMRRVVTSMLAGMGFDDVCVAGDGREGLRQLAAAPVDLLLTNWNMPELDGLDLVRAARAMPEYRSLPILMFTSRVSRQDVVRALEAGVDGYVAKPFTPGELREQILQVLRRHARRRIERVTRALQRPGLGDQYPLVIIGEATVHPGELARPENAAVLRLLDDTVTAVQEINGDDDGPLVGILAGSDSTSLARLLHAVGDRARALILSTGVRGGGLTLARLVSVNRRSGVAVFVTGDDVEQLPKRVRTSLENLGVTILERSSLDPGALRQLVTEHVVVPGRQARPVQLPPPEEIRRRLRTDILTTVVLPVMPKVYHDIATLATDPDSDIQVWIDAIRADPLSCAQVIRRARSPAYGFRGEIRDVDKAVVLLGRSAVKQLVVSDAVQRAFQGVQEDRFDIDDFWLHSVAVALTARLLALPTTAPARTAEQQAEHEPFGLDDATVALLQRLDIPGRLHLGPELDPFTAGMMHDVGKVALVQSYPGLYPAVVAELQRQGWAVPMRVAEQHIAGGADHAAVGAILAESWQLGHDVERTVRQHHEPDLADGLTSLVAIADLVVGGFQAYPAEGRYPLVGQVAAATTADADAEPPGDAFAQALTPFLPEAAWRALGWSVGDLVELSRGLAGGVRRRASQLRDCL